MVGKPKLHFLLHTLCCFEAFVVVFFTWVAFLYNEFFKIFIFVHFLLFHWVEVVAFDDCVEPAGHTALANPRLCGPNGFCRVAQSPP